MVFKAYDLRGRVPEELDEAFMRRLGRVYPTVFAAPRLALGWDARLSSPGLAAALADGLCDAGVSVDLLGQCATEQVYFAAKTRDGGLMVTASHNPANWNGVKLIGPHATPVTRTQLAALRHAMDRAEDPAPTAPRGRQQPHEITADYLEHLLSYVGPLNPLKIVANPGNGVMGPLIDQLAPHLPLEWIRLQWPPDGYFPFGVPNPLVAEHREITAQTVRDSGADFGLAWDGDGDRCFFFDERGRFIEGYYLVGLLAEILLARAPQCSVVHDPRLIWNTQAKVIAAGGVPVQSVTGHAFMKATMREVNAIYGGEMSAHHYFRAFAYCDSGMIPWLLMADYLSRTELKLGALVDQAMADYPCSGEINFPVNHAAAAMARVHDYFANDLLGVDHADGLSLDGGDWRCNLRCSNTEALLRLNVETRGQPTLLDTRVDEIKRLILLGN